MLQRNIDDLERFLRVLLGVYAMLLGFLFISGLVGNLLGFVGLLAVVTGAVGWCGSYALLGSQRSATAGSTPMPQGATVELTADGVAVEMSQDELHEDEDLDSSSDDQAECEEEEASITTAPDED